MAKAAFISGCFYICAFQVTDWIIKFCVLSQEHAKAILEILQSEWLQVTSTIINPQRMRRGVIVVSFCLCVCVTHNLREESLSLLKQASIQSK